MKKLEQIDYSNTERMGINTILGKIDNLKIGEGFKISNFPNYQKMRDLTEKVEPHLSECGIFRRVANEKNLTYTIRRAA